MISRAYWTFDNITDWFDDHIRRSIPGYQLGHDLVVSAADYFIWPSGCVYDIGCATGMLTHRLATKAAKKNARVIGIDTEHTMIQYAKTQYTAPPEITWLCDDSCSHEFEHNCDMIIAYYTIQFIRPDLRAALLTRIYDALRVGGCFIMFEKIHAETGPLQDINIGLYTDFKLDHGHSADDIMEKTRQIRQVLTPQDSASNKALLKQAGFKTQSTIFRHSLFEGVLAIKR